MLKKAAHHILFFTFNLRVYPHVEQMGGGGGGGGPLALLGAVALICDAYKTKGRVTEKEREGIGADDLRSCRRRRQRRPFLLPDSTPPARVPVHLCMCARARMRASLFPSLPLSLTKPNPKPYTSALRF